MKRATEVFGEWAEQGKDRGMEKSHAMPVEDMLDFVLSEKSAERDTFSFLDLGCGNGWVVRKMAKNNLCNRAVGIDGARQMISNARRLSENQSEYILADINEYNSPEKFDVIHSMEVMYYLADPKNIINEISNSWLKPNGRLIVGVDHYFENEESHTWQEKVGTRMLMYTEKEWIGMFRDANFNDVKAWRSNQSIDWSGTLIVTGKKAI